MSPDTHSAMTDLKLMIVGRRKPGTTLAEHRRHIRDVHGELVLDYVAAEPDNAPRRYAQNAVFDGYFRASAPGTDPFALNRDFVTQIWVPDVVALKRSTATAFYLDKLKPDEDNFVDQATVVFMPTRERELHRRNGSEAAAPGAHKLFVMLQRAAGADAAAFASAWSSAATALPGLPAAARVQRHVQNDVLTAPTGRAPLDGIDEFWLDDEASARELLTQWQGWLREALVRPGLVTEGGHFALLATEQVLYAGTPRP